MRARIVKGSGAGRLRDAAGDGTANTVRCPQDGGVPPRTLGLVLPALILSSSPIALSRLSTSDQPDDAADEGVGEGVARSSPLSNSDPRLLARFSSPASPRQRSGTDDRCGERASRRARRSSAGIAMRRLGCRDVGVDLERAVERSFHALRIENDKGQLVSFGSWGQGGEGGGGGARGKEDEPATVFTIRFLRLGKG